MRSLTPAEYIRNLSRRCSAVVLFALSYIIALEGQVLTQDEAIANALRSYPSVQLAEMEVRMQKALEKGAFNPEQPELTFEFPNDVGVVFDLRQSFDFPSVYGARKKWFKAQTDQQAQAAGITRQELIRDVRLAYLDAQVAAARLQIFARQDSLWGNMDSISQRLYAGGQINRAAELFSAKQAGLVHQFRLDAQVSATNALLTLESYTGNRVMQLDPLNRLPFSISDTSDQYYFEAFFLPTSTGCKSRRSAPRTEELRLTASA